AVNLSQRQFNHPDLFEQIKTILQTTGVASENLKIEVTESLLMDDIDQKKLLLSALHKLGIKISLDDFGTGYSSLSYLKELPFFALKIDKSFIQDIDTSDDSEMIVS